MTPAQYPASQVPPEALVGAVCVMLIDDQVTVYYRAEDVPPPPIDPAATVDPIAV